MKRGFLVIILLISAIILFVLILSFNFFIQISKDKKKADLLEKAEAVFKSPEVVNCDLINITDPGRETYNITNIGYDKMSINFKDHRGFGKTITFAKSLNGMIDLIADNDSRNISVRESQEIHYQELVFIGNEAEGYLLKLSSVGNQSTGFSNDYVRFTDVFSGNTLDATITGEGIGTFILGNKSYNVAYSGDASDAVENYIVKINYPDSGISEMILYPSIQTEKGAKIMLYEPIMINMMNWDGNGNSISKIRIPDGDGYSDINFQKEVSGVWNITGAGNGTLNTSLPGLSVNLEISKLNFVLSTIGSEDFVRLNLREISSIWITEPALIILEEKDSNNNINAIILTLDEGSTSTDGMGISDIQRTWNNNSNYEFYIGNDKIKACDLWGTIAISYLSDADQVTVDISYPDNQVNFQPITEVNKCSELDDSVIEDIKELESQGLPVVLKENADIKYQNYVVINNDTGGKILRLVDVVNDTNNYANDKVSFSDKSTGQFYVTVITAEGTGILVIDGKEINIRYHGDSSDVVEDYIVNINWDPVNETDVYIGCEVSGIPNNEGDSGEGSGSGGGPSNGEGSSVAKKITQESNIGFWNKTILINEEEFNEGYSGSYAKKERVNIRLNGIDYYVGVVELTLTNTIINVSSIHQLENLEIGNEKEFDITGDGHYDMVVKLEKIENNKAYINIRPIREKIPVEIQEVSIDEQKPYLWLVLIIILLVLIAIVIFLIIKKITQNWKSSNKL